MQDQELRELLDDLPRARASADFTGRTIKRLRAEKRRPRTWRKPILVVAGCTLLFACAVPIWMHVSELNRRAQASSELAALRSEHAQLAAEINTLRQPANRPLPVLYLGSTDSVDYVLDLRQLAQRRASPDDQNVPIQQASF